MGVGVEEGESLKIVSNATKVYSIILLLVHTSGAHFWCTLLLYTSGAHLKGARHYLLVTISTPRYQLKFSISSPY